MEVQVLHALAGVAAAVAHHAEAALGDTLLMRDRPARPQARGKQLVGQRIHRIQRRDVRLRNDQHMHRRHRVDVAESVGLVILVDLGGGNVPGDDFAEQAVFHENHPFYG